MKNDSLTRTLLAPLALGLLLPLGVLSYSGCKKDEPPPPLPSAAPANTPSAPLVLEVEDAGPDVEDADADADVKIGPYKPAASMKACCAALQQNAASAPPPTNIYMMSAAAACNAAVAQGKDKSTIVGIVSGALKGAGMPAACR
jgi:hypothetical protein